MLALNIYKKIDVAVAAVRLHICRYILITTYLLLIYILLFFSFLRISYTHQKQVVVVTAKLLITTRLYHQTRPQKTAYNANAVPSILSYLFEKPCIFFIYPTP